MSFRSILAALRSVSPAPRAQTAAQRPGFRPRLEALEDRRTPSFSPAVNYAAGTYPHAVVTADFNNDSVLDVAVLNSGGGGGVLLGNADGTFQPPQTLAAGYGPFSLAVGDFNNDGKVDLVTEYRVLIGNGDGTFQPPVFTGVTIIGAYSVAVGDFNADGKMDVVVGNSGDDYYYNYYHYAEDNQVQVLLGNGEGGFTPGEIESVPWTEQLTLVVADVNGDGRSDLLAGSYEYVSVLLGNPDGTLSYTRGASDYYTSNATIGLAVGDFTGDGALDVLSAGNTLVNVLPCLGGGTFGAPIYTLAWNNVQTAVAVADFNGDGRLDVVTTDRVENGVTAFLGLGNGTFNLIGDHVVGASPWSIAVGDFNGDGRPDAVTANSGSNTLSVLLNDGSWDEPPPPPSLRISDVTVTEGNTGTQSATFTVTLSAASTQAITVAYATTDGTATAGSDYQATSGTLTIPAGQTSRTVTIFVNGDRLPEPNENFVVNLSSPTNATIADGQGIGTIRDDEPRISITDVSRAEGNAGQTTLFTFTVTLSAAYDQAVTMSFRTANGTARTNQGDYIARTGTLTFAPGETTKTITIEVKGDSKREANEYFYLDLSGNSSNSWFSKNRGIGTIANDD